MSEKHEGRTDIGKRELSDKELSREEERKDCPQEALRVDGVQDEAGEEAPPREELLRHARLKALALLQYKDRTEHELRMRLKKESYPDEVVEDAIAYVKSFHYLDDLRYAENFIRSKAQTKSSLQIQMLLEQKGVDREIIAQAFEEQEEDEEPAELEAIRRAICRKTDDVEALTREEKQKLCASLYRKGFRSVNIRKAMRMYEEE